LEFQRIAAGAFVAHETKVDGRGWTVIEAPSGPPFGAISARPDEQRSSRGDPKYLGTDFEAADGTWFVPHVQGLDEHRAVLGVGGKEVAGIDRTSSTTRLLHLPGGDVTWESHLTRPQYRIDGLYGASRTALHTFVAGLSRRPFRGELTDALAGRPDASLVVLFASWLALATIGAKVAAASTATGTP